jgi:hypothetical protein
MQVTYLTLDEVNRFTMQSWAKKSGMQLHCPIPSDILVLPEETDAIVLDLDYLPAEIRATWLSRVEAGATTGCLLVHGHNITDGEVKRLRRQGVHICQGQLRRDALISWLRDLGRIEASTLPRARATAHLARSPIKSRTAGLRAA